MRNVGKNNIKLYSQLDFIPLNICAHKAAVMNKNMAYM